MITKVYKAARWFIANNDYKLSNVFIFDWESDLFCLTKSGYAIEIEVKVSRSDFLADFKKPKHKLLQAAFEKVKYLMIDKKDASKNRETGEYYVNSYNACSFKYIQPSDKTPNRFYFAVPYGLVSVEEVPAYAGLIYIDENERYFVKKPAPLIHKTKINFQNSLLSKFYHRRNNALNEALVALNSVKNAQPENIMGIATYALGKIKSILE